MTDDKHINWFEHWFDSPYYHILYKHRNCDEAELLIDNLIDYLNPQSNSRFLDVGCGKGRHSIYLNKKGYSVTGIDLSSESIAFASQFKNKNLEFYAEDMRKIDRINQFDYILNLFTSFGYFENESDDYATINCLSKALKPNGIFVLDFMNTHKVIENLISQETSISNNIEFTIKRTFENNFIIKHIHFSEKGKEYNFQERVKALTIKDFKKYFTANKLKILSLHGDYNLEEFNPETSDRLIMITQKE
jgi:SAM-dependent methyltransferase